jgi:hypothetical protein
MINSYRPHLFKKLIGARTPTLTHYNSSAHIDINKKIKKEWKIASQPLKSAKFIACCGLFTSAYLYMISKAKKSENELIRIGASGSLTILACEVAFFPLDSLNLQQKVSVNNIGTM